MSSPNAWAYGNEALSDVTIAFIPKGTAATKSSATKGQKRKAGQEGEDDPQAISTIPGHKFVMATFSEYYRALFLRWEKDEKMVKLEYDDADDLAAAQACIKALYLQKLDAEDLHSEPASAIPILVKVIHWADMLQAPTCTELCIACLASCLRPGSAEDINWVLEGLPDSVRCSPAFSKVQEVCQEWLQHSFTDVYEVITKKELLEAFQKLSNKGLLLWMKCDNLMGTENDVAFLVAKWHEGEKGRKATEEDLVALSRELRVCRLAKSVQECVLPTWPHWFQEDHLLPVFATAYRRYGSDAPGELTSVSIPRAWVAPAREGTIPDMARVTEAREWFVWKVPITAILQMLDEMDMEEEEAHPVREFHSDEFYSDGTTFSAYLELTMKRPDAQLELCLVNKCEHIIDASYSVRQSCPGRNGNLVDQKIIEGSTLFDTSNAVGGTVAEPTASLMAVLQEEAVDGHLVFKIKVHPV